MNTPSCPNFTANPLLSLLRRLAPPARSRPVATPPAPTAVAEQIGAGYGKKILLVDDDAIVLKTTAMKLKSQSYTVTTASDGAGAIRAARNERPDLILLDLSFPADVGGVAWDGFLIISWLRRVPETKDIPVIIITGGEPARNQDRSLTNGALAFFHKPLDHDALLSVIEGAVRQESRPRQLALVADFQL